MSDSKDRWIAAQKAADLATQLVIEDARLRVDDYAIFDEGPPDHGTLTENIFNTIVRLAHTGEPEKPRGGGRKAPAKKAATSGRSRRRSDAEPEADTWEELSEETQGAILTALNLLPGRTELDEDNASDLELAWADCIVWNPDDWWDNRGDRKAPKGGPTFRHREIEDNQGRGVGLWIDGKAPTPEWVHTLIPYRDTDVLFNATF